MKNLTLTKSSFAAVCVVLFVVFEAPTVMANEIQQIQAKADRYYQQGIFNKAYKNYLKLAKKGDHYSQDRISQMYVKGEGKSASLNQAYAWSVLAAESGEDQLVKNSIMLLQHTNDPAKAKVSAAKLKKKYGKQALDRKAALRAKHDNQRQSGRCTGTRLPCKAG